MLPISHLIGSRATSKVRMTKDKDDTAAAAPFPTMPTSSSVASSPLSDLCAEWLATDAEIDRMSTRWATLETRLASDEPSVKRVAPQRRSPHQIAEMLRLEVRINALSADLDQLLKLITQAQATALPEAIAKLEIAIQLLAFDHEPARRLIADAARSVRDHRCGEPGTDAAPQG